MYNQESFVIAHNQLNHAFHNCFFIKIPIQFTKTSLFKLEISN